MGTSLINTKPQDTYPGLIKTTDNAAISATLKTLSDGNGNDFPMQISTTAVNFTGTLTQNGSPVTTPPSGVSGAIQFSNGSAFASDATNLFWDDTNNRLGVGTNAPSHNLDVTGTTQLSYINGTGILVSGSDVLIRNYSSSNNTFKVISRNSANTLTDKIITTNGTDVINLNGQAQIKGSGSTSATTSLLVQNSAGTDRFKIQDDGTTTLTVSKGTLSNSIIGPEARIAIVPYSASIGTLFNSVSTNGGANYPITFWATDFFAELTGGLQIATSAVSVNASAKLQVDSTTRGFLPPRMTTTQKTNISSPAEGLVVYDTTLGKLCVRTASAWETITSV